jgi:hypothetical protein
MLLQGLVIDATRGRRRCCEGKFAGATPAYFSGRLGIIPVEKKVTALGRDKGKVT